MREWRRRNAHILRSSRLRYPWLTLEVGESFLAAEQFTTTSGFGGHYNQANKRARKDGRPHRFQARAEEVDGQRRVRVYRVR